MLDLSSFQEVLMSTSTAEPPNKGERNMFDIWTSAIYPIQVFHLMVYAYQEAGDTEGVNCKWLPSHSAYFREKGLTSARNNLNFSR